MKRANKNRRGKPRNRNIAFDFESLEGRKLMAGLTGSAPSLMPHHGPAEAIQFSNQDQELPSPDSVQRIVNGEQTSGYEAVGFVGPLGCTGTLISPTHVLTAAHCLEGISNTGATFEVNGQVYNSSAVTIHPNYNPNNFSAGYDVAIITLNREVQGVTPMEINRTTPVVGTMLTLVGFGEGGTSTGGFDPNDTGKQVGQTELEGVTNHHLTWTFDSHDEANTAPGDSGGPAFITVGGQEVIAGVTSGGSGDPHQLGDESFDTRIDVHAAWIDSIVGDDGGGGGGGGDNDDHADGPGADATKINLKDGAGTGNGTLEAEGDRDAFTFTLAEDGETTISLTGTSNQLDTYLRIYDSNGRLIHQNDDANGTFDSQVTANLAAGKYFAVAGSYQDAGTGSFRLDIQHEGDDSGGGNGDYTFSNNRPQDISPNGRDRVISNINVSGVSGDLTDINVTVDIDHTYTSDLRLILVAPDNTRIVLVNRQGDDGDNFDSTTFDQDASTHINRGDAPFRGSFRPVRSLDNLVGMNPNGRWRLVVRDMADLDGGRLNSWSIDLETDQPRQRQSLPNRWASTNSSQPVPNRSGWNVQNRIGNQSFNRIDRAFVSTEFAGHQSVQSSEDGYSDRFETEVGRERAGDLPIDEFFGNIQFESLFLV